MTWYQFGLRGFGIGTVLNAKKYSSLDSAKDNAEGMLLDDDSFDEACIYEISGVTTLRKKSVVEEVEE